MTPLGAVVATAALLVLAACAASPQDPGTQPADPYAATDRALRDRTFVSTAVTVEASRGRW